jgi:hypothetical protein
MLGSGLRLVDDLSAVPSYETQDDRFLAGGGNDKARGGSRGQGTDLVYSTPGVDAVSDHREIEHPVE